MKRIEISKIKLNKKNPRTITEENLRKLVRSVKEFSAMLILRPIVLNTDMMILGGNMRIKALKIAGYTKAPYAIFTQEMCDEMNKEAREDLPPREEKTYKQYSKEFIIKDNIAFGKWVEEMLLIEDDWDPIEMKGWGLDLPSWNDIEFEDTSDEKHRKLEDLFRVPPFSILDSKQGYWMDRKKTWRELIGDKGETRSEKLYEYSKTSEVTAAIAKIGTVSLLDPVLAEISNHWFGIDGGKTFDPFAGDSVFGFVSNHLGNKFTGIELRQEQTDLNNNRLEGSNSNYICDDGRNVGLHIKKNSQDLLFSCPPYYNLEVYSDLENDASNQESYEDFIKILDTAFSESIKCLKKDRFAVIVVGDIRNKKTGEYYNFVDHVKAIFNKHGMVTYNDMILVNPFGTAPQRASRQMKTRKVVKVHQNMLVFYKGNTKNIEKNYKNLGLSNEIQDGVEVMQAQPNDLEPIIAFRKPFVKEKLIMYLSKAIIDEAIGKGDIHVCLQEEEVVGYLWLHNLKQKPFAKIEEICSSKQGLGTELMLLAEELCVHETIKLEVVNYNEKAIGFYLRRGYEVTSERKSGKITNLVMQKKLNGSENVES